MVSVDVSESVEQKDAVDKVGDSGDSGDSGDGVLSCADVDISALTGNRSSRLNDGARDALEVDGCGSSGD